MDSENDRANDVEPTFKSRNNRRKRQRFASSPTAANNLLPAVLFLSIIFSSMMVWTSFGDWYTSPERVFSDAPQQEETTKATTSRRVVLGSRPNLFIAGCAKHVEAHLPELEVGFRDLQREWNLSGIWMYVDDNLTYSVLRDWYVYENSTVPTTLMNPTNLVRILDGGDSEEPLRTVRLSECRKALWRAMFDYQDRKQPTGNSDNVITYVMMMDFDEVNYHMSGVSTCLDMPDGSWYGCCANQYSLYYDIWALRAQGWLECDFKNCAITTMRKRRGRKQNITAKQKLGTFLNKVRNRRVFKGQRESQKRTKPEDKDRRRRLGDLPEDEEQITQENEMSSSTAFVSFGGRGKTKKGELSGNTLREMAMLQRMSQNRSDLVGSQQLLSKQERISTRSYRHIPASLSPFAVDSCFGGATLYDAFRWKETFQDVASRTYIPTLKLGRGGEVIGDTCEHVSFHLTLNTELGAETGGPQLFLQPKFLTAGVVNSSRERWGRLLKDKEESFLSSWHDETLTPYYGKYLRALELGPQPMVAALPTVLEKDESSKV